MKLTTLAAFSSPFLLAVIGSSEGGGFKGRRNLFYYFLFARKTITGMLGHASHLYH